MRMNEGTDEKGLVRAENREQRSLEMEFLSLASGIYSWPGLFNA